MPGTPLENQKKPMAASARPALNECKWLSLQGTPIDSGADDVIRSTAPAINWDQRMSGRAWRRSAANGRCSSPRRVNAPSCTGWSMTCWERTERKIGNATVATRVYEPSSNASISHLGTGAREGSYEPTKRPLLAPRRTTLPGWPEMVGIMKNGSTPFLCGWVPMCASRHWQVRESE